ncbi:MAG: sulfur transferase domain-containing protein [Planctomycetota bacterium]
MIPRSILLSFLFLASCSSPAPKIENLRHPLPDIWSSGQPTQEQFDQLPAMGIHRVIQLRPASENGTGWEEERARTSGIEFVRIPVAGAEGLTRANVDQLAAALKKPTKGGTLVCCASGNRVGALLALKARWVDGATAEAALELGRAAGVTKLEPKLQELLK